jgi:hypothetical protein
MPDFFNLARSVFTYRDFVSTAVMGLAQIGRMSVLNSAPNNDDLPLLTRPKNATSLIRQVFANSTNQIT